MLSSLPSRENANVAMFWISLDNKDKILQSFEHKAPSTQSTAERVCVFEEFRKALMKEDLFPFPRPGSKKD